MSALNLAERSLPPLRRFTLTNPLVRSPYCTDGMPRTMVTSCMSSVEMVRISTPALAKFRLPEVRSTAPERYCMLPFTLTGAPSMMKRVPNEEVLYWSLAMGTSRRFMVLGTLRWGSWARPPGSSSSKSEKLEGCRCSMACRLMVETLDKPCPSCAVTTTSCRLLTSTDR